MENKKTVKVIKPWDDSVKEDHAGRVGGMRNLIEIEVETDDGYIFSYLVKRPNRSVSAASVDAGLKNDYGTVQKLMLGCVLEGDREAYENDGAIYNQLSEKIGMLLQSAKSRIKKN